LGAQDFAVQIVALDVADQLAVEVELVLPLTSETLATRRPRL
jgi:hypothetical protein